MSDETIRAAAYVRVSTKTQADEGLSLEVQQAKVERHIADRRHPDPLEHRPAWVQVAKTFVEKGVSGRRDDRPELARLMRLVDARAIDVLVIPKLDRLGRSLAHLTATFERLKAANVALVSLADNIDTSTTGGKLMRNMLAVLAEFESDNISERVAGVSIANAEKGKHHGTPPYGYRAIKGKVMQVVQTEATVIRRIYRLYVKEGLSQREIARRLNAEGVPGRKGPWQQSTISRILANPVYVGLVEVHGKQYPGLHKAIINQAMWNDAQKRRRSMERSRRGASPRAGHLLGGLLTCPGCGEVMHAHFRTDAAGAIRWEAYVCAKRVKQGVEACHVGPLMREPIDRAVQEFVTRTALDAKATEKALLEQADANIAENRVLLAQAQREALRVEKDRAKVKRDYLDGDKDVRALLAEFQTELSAEAEAVAANIERLTKQAQALTAEHDQVAAHSAMLAQVATSLLAPEIEGVTSPDAMRALLRRLFVKFETHFSGQPLPSLTGPGADSVLWADENVPKIGNLIILPHVHPDAIDMDADHFPAIHRVAAPGHSDRPIKLSLLFELERLEPLLRDGNQPFVPDRDLRAFQAYLVDLGCQPPPSAGLDRPPRGS